LNRIPSHPLSSDFTHRLHIVEIEVLAKTLRKTVDQESTMLGSIDDDDSVPAERP
jgi:hypothetical protein